jgi:Fe-S-cluster containining protein
MRLMILEMVKECEECCNCCRTGIVSQNILSEKAIEFYRVKAYLTIEDGNRMVFFLYEPCPKLDEATGLCTIYDERPQTCREFPTDKNCRSDWRYICPLIQNMREKKGPHVIVDGSTGRVEHMKIKER